jgi:hypothetical protein
MTIMLRQGTINGFCELVVATKGPFTTNLSCAYLTFEIGTNVLVEDS